MTKHDKAINKIMRSENCDRATAERFYELSKRLESPDFTPEHGRETYAELEKLRAEKGHTIKISQNAVRRLQKDGEYRFNGLSREESRTAAETLARAAMEEDRRNGIESCFGIARDAFGYYFAAQING